jgi:protein TonB
MPRFALPARLRPHRLLLWTLGLSLLIHLSLLTFRLAAPQAYQRVFQDTPLEVTLVNAHSSDTPEQAQALAQKRLAGGGEIAQVVLSTSPLPPQPSEESGSDMSASQRQIETLKMQQMMLLSVLRQELAELQKQEVGDSPRGAREGTQEQRKRQLSQQLAAIEQRVQATQGAARKRYISPATEETPYAIYYDKLRRTIELKGTQHFPEAAGQKLYGKLIMVITIDSQGQLLSTELAESSGNPLLDERAIAIVRSTAPFDVFTPRMRRHADQIVVVSSFRFARDNNLRTRMLSPRQE